MQAAGLQGADDVAIVLEDLVRRYEDLVKRSADLRSYL